MNFSIEAASKSKECPEDDAEFIFKSKGKAIKLDIPKGWYYNIANVGSVKSTCKSTTYDEYPIFRLNQNQALIFLRVNRRPGLDGLSVVLIDYEKGKVLDHKDLGRTMRSSTGIFQTVGGYKLPVIKENLKEVRCDCDAGFVEGWLKVSVVKEKIRTNWLN